MSEEELVILQNIQYALDNVGSFDLGDFSYDDIQGLLDLYNKEKEKNKKLLKERKSNAEKYIHNNPWLYKELNERYVFKADIEKDYINKDKIREKINNTKGNISKSNLIRMIEKIEEEQ